MRHLQRNSSWQVSVPVPPRCTTDRAFNADVQAAVAADEHVGPASPDQCLHFRGTTPESAPAANATAAGHSSAPSASVLASTRGDDLPQVPGLARLLPNPTGLALCLQVQSLQMHCVVLPPPP